MIILDTVRESYENDSGKDALSRLRVVCRASRVCRSWRLMALQNPLWWTDIAIYMQRFNPVELTADTPTSVLGAKQTQTKYGHFSTLVYSTKGGV